MKKDRKGIEVKEGDVVAIAITINNRRFGFPFTTHICRKNKEGALILDGSLGWQYLDSAESNHIQVLTPDTDMRALHCEFFQEFTEKADSWDRKYISTDDAHQLYEDLCNVIDHDVYGDSVDFKGRADQVLNIIRELVRQEVQKDGCEKLKEAIKVIDSLNAIREEALKLTQSTRI